MPKLPTINIKGNEYTLVKDRVLYFNQTFENGSIETKLLSKPDARTIVFKAKVTPDTTNPNRVFTGHASETVGDGYINEAAAMENAETSAIGRALASMGVGIIDSIASVDEINKAENTRSNNTKPLSPKQKKWLEKLAFTYEMADGTVGTSVENLGNEVINKTVKTQADFQLLIDQLKEQGVIDV